MRERDVFVRMRLEHKNIAKSMASAKGMTLKDYLGKKVEEEAGNLRRDVTQKDFVRGRVYFDFPFK